MKVAHLIILAGLAISILSQSLHAKENHITHDGTQSQKVVEESTSSSCHWWDGDRGCN
ncbi:MAG: hypothetical protein JSR85_05750 [Proteobacteria bacterium]|nr:hypothetical protein [Pseudomonadota bacterium]